MKSSRFSTNLRNHPGLPSGNIDLHMHSKFSDGAMGVKDLIRFCHGKGLSAMAVTDHDNIDSFEEGKDLAEELGIEYVPGVEISSTSNGSDIHILGYLFDPTNLKLNQTLVDLQRRRKIRARIIVKKLNRQGVNISYDKVAEKAKEGSVGRAHIATLLVEEEYVANFAEAFRKYLSSDLLDDIGRTKLSPQEAIQLISDAGGVPVLAHPSKSNCDDLIGEMVDAGLRGIETYCHGQTAKTCQKYRDLARKYNLICSGGTDFHTHRLDGRYDPGSLHVPYRVLGFLKEAQ